jgi:hypothetical protein
MKAVLSLLVIMASLLSVGVKAANPCAMDSELSPYQVLTISDTAYILPQDTLSQVRRAHHKHPVRRFFKFINRQMESFSDVDTNYIEPQHYNYEFMLQQTITYEQYTLRALDSGQMVEFSPRNSYKFGPYFGWRWIFLGYTFDVKNLSLGLDDHKPKTEFDVSLYSSLFGIDFYYRRTGNDYRINSINLGKNVDVTSLEDKPFTDINVGITGLNLYYIFNHRKFSHPAAFSQSTCQKVSAGSMIAGISYTKQSLDYDYEDLEDLIHSNPATAAVQLDSSLMFRQVKYTDVSISLGYAYNWVFRPKWLFAVSLSPALAYNQSHGDVKPTVGLDGIKGFSFKNVNIDFISRFGLVWNNTKWYAGANAILHGYNYKKSRFAARNIFGSFNIYVGFNFAKRKEYRHRR